MDGWMEEGAGQTKGITKIYPLCTWVCLEMLHGSAVMECSATLHRSFSSSLLSVTTCEPSSVLQHALLCFLWLQSHTRVHEFVYRFTNENLFVWTFLMQTWPS